MQIRRLLLGAFTYFVILFASSGASQMLPWGVPSVKSFRAASPSTVQNFGVTDLRVMAPHVFTTEAFDEAMVDQVNTLMTDKSFSYIVTKPLSYYSPARYMSREALTQAVVALILTLLLGLTTSMTLKKRLTVLLLTGVAAVCATYGQLLNWWGLTAHYAVGAAVNLVLAWLIGGLVVARFIIKSTEPSRAGPRKDPERT
jgi:hypothetical protein